MFTEVIKKLISPLLGKKKWQKLYMNLYRLSLLGMNIGGGANPKDSGEINSLKYVKKKIGSKSKPIIFDVGANIGQYTLLLCDIFGNDSIIYSFEPSKKAFQSLSINIGNKGNIILNNFGFGDENRRSILYTNSDCSGLASVYKRRMNHFNIHMAKCEEIEIKTVDSYCENKGIRHIHFLKLDVEGHELKILEGAEKLLTSGSIDFIQFEFGGCNIDSRTYFQDFYYLLKDRYRIYRILKDGLYMLDNYKEIYETFIPTNYLAERK